jgi:multidrug efflux pump subunit AcrB
MASHEDLRNIPITARGAPATLLRNVADVSEGTAVGEYERYNMQRTLTLTANVHGTGLGEVDRQIAAAIAQAGAPPPKTSVAVRGQLAPLRELLSGLRSGLLITVAVIFLLLAANFQSLRLALAVVTTVPAVIAGVVVALRASGTTLNVQSFMGAIMAVGVAVANAVLLVTFAERLRRGGADRLDAAVEGARGRLRPILMTSAAMIAGMVPMALGLGDGGEQTAPLGRAVIGGLVGATAATLLVLPAVFAVLAGRRAVSASLDPDDAESRYYGVRGA